ncbi:YnbE family lipoprotein [Desulforhopalus vacuolatus]|uniref:YnbE family lipoprotein n=1 Tax=Desulforhopalus vacuolatus TaxID=40414 RepID=UPI001965F618|nr:YnbE family lipoprotein [Desulforhopalus vacuolatus]MBM9519920.1 YnbE family lipoprotein [Desulforhopalus vacuolatus]
MKLHAVFLLAASFVFLAAGCTRHEIDVKPVEIKPIHITIDINVKVDRALDNFFGDLDEQAAAVTSKTGNAPAKSNEGGAP